MDPKSTMQNTPKLTAAIAAMLMTSFRFSRASSVLGITGRVNDPAPIGSRLQPQRDRGVRFSPIVMPWFSHELSWTGMDEALAPPGFGVGAQASRSRKH